MSLRTVNNDPKNPANRIGNRKNNPRKEITVTTRTITPDELAKLADDGAEPKKARRTKGVPQEECAAYLATLPLQRTDKSAAHYHKPGEPKGARLVVPRGTGVTKLYCYKLTDAGSPGFKTEDERKAEGLGAVTNVITVGSLDDVKSAAAAVMKACGLSVPQENTGSSEKAKKPGRGGSKGPRRATNQKQEAISVAASEPDDAA